MGAFAQMAAFRQDELWQETGREIRMGISRMPAASIMQCLTLEQTCCLIFVSDEKAKDHSCLIFVSDEKAKDHSSLIFVSDEKAKDHRRLR